MNAKPELMALSRKPFVWQKKWAYRENEQIPINIHCAIWVCIVNNLVRPASWKWSSFYIRSWSVAPSTHCLILRMRAFKQGCLMRKLNICWKNCYMIMKEGSRLNIYLFELSFSDEVWMSRSVWRHVQMLRIWTLSLLINIERLFVY